MRRRGHFWNRLEWDRVEAEVHTMRMDAEAARRRLEAKPDADADGWLRKSFGHLERAERLVLASGGNTNPAWRALHRAREAWVCTLGPARLRMEADDLLRRASGLPRGKGDLVRKWLKPVVETPLPKNGEERPAHLPDHRERVMRALHARNDHWDVHFHGVVLQETRVGALVVVLVGLLVLLFLSVLRGHVTLVPDVSPGFVVTIALVGAMGGTVTAMMASLKQDEKTLLPYQRAQGPWLVSRPLLGASSALVVATAVAHGAFGVALGDPSLYVPLAFASGFSEVLLLRLVDRLTNGHGKEEPTPDPPTPEPLPDAEAPPADGADAPREDLTQGLTKASR